MMKALIFAAGLGERMRPLTDHTPKPLLVAGNKPLIVWHIEKLSAAGVGDIVINTSWLASQFSEQLGDGSRWGVRLHFIYEGTSPLETGGGMLHALPLLCSDNDQFISVNGDIWTDFDFASLRDQRTAAAHLVMVDNPEHHPLGDFHLSSHGVLLEHVPPALTFSGIGLYHRDLLQYRHNAVDAALLVSTTPAFKLAPLLKAAMRDHKLTGQYHAGQWTDVGTPARLALLNQQLTS